MSKGAVFPLKKERAGDWQPCRRRNVSVVFPPFPSQVKQHSFAPWALIWPLRPPFLPAVLSILTTHTPWGPTWLCLSRAKHLDPDLALLPPLLCIPREWYRGPQPQGTPDLAGCEPEQCTPTCFFSKKEGLSQPCCATFGKLQFVLSGNIWKHTPKWNSQSAKITRPSATRLTRPLFVSGGCAALCLKTWSHLTEVGAPLGRFFRLLNTWLYYLRKWTNTPALYFSWKCALLSLVKR